MFFTIWTRFEIPDSVLFNVGDPYRIPEEFDQQLIDSVRYLIKAPGHMVSAWGRVSEQPEKIILASCKTHSKALLYI
jgi:hypothetical protein